MKNSIKVERATLNITQAELAVRAEVSRQAINNVEKGRYVPSTILAIKIAGIFGKTVEEIFEIEEGD